MARIEEIGAAGAAGRATRYARNALLMLLVLAAIGFVYTGIDRVRSGEAAVVIDNLTRTESPVTRVGYIVHLPFGLSDVYKFPIVDRNLFLQGNDSVTVKTSDGSNVNVDVLVKYRVRRDDRSLILLAQNFGRDVKLAQADQLVRSFVLACLRDALVQLPVQKIIEGNERQQQAQAIAESLNRRLDVFGIAVDTVSLPKPQLRPEYQALIDQRKDADNVLLNQISAQEEARQSQAALVAEATRQWHTAVEEEKGRQEKRVIEANGLAKQKEARAEGMAERTRVDGDKSYQVALDQSKAVRSEGLAKALGISKLAEAYDIGGLSLVREALAAKYLGRTINGRPYDQAGVVQAMSIEPSSTAAAAAVAPPASAPAKGANR